MEKQISVITIDGPGGSGKGTIAYLVARSLGWHLLDSGALYRVLALAARLHSVKLSDEEALIVLAAHLDVQFYPTEGNSACDVILEGEQVNADIRTEECGVDASRVAVLPGVRAALLERQRAFAEVPGLVADGRDMGTVVFSDAPLKIYLTASSEERAKRRYKQLKDKGIDVSLRALFEDIKARDERDENRSVSPLKPAEDAIILDSTDMRIDEVFDKVTGEAKSRALT